MLGKPQDGSLARNSILEPVLPTSPQIPTPKAEAMLYTRVRTQQGGAALAEKPYCPPGPSEQVLGRACRMVLFTLQSEGTLLGEGSQPSRLQGDLQLAAGLVLPRDSHCSAPVPS